MLAILTTIRLRINTASNLGHGIRLRRARLRVPNGRKVIARTPIAKAFIVFANVVGFLIEPDEITGESLVVSRM
jgi:hypothetical protein